MIYLSATQFGDMLVVFARLPYKQRKWYIPACHYDQRYFITTFDIEGLSSNNEPLSEQT